MNARAGEIAVVGAGVAYLVALGWAMGNVSYDIWGALVVIPVYAIIGLAFVRRMFQGAQQTVARILAWGLLVKLVGALARYWVGFEAYEGGIDAGRYHQFAVEVAGKVWSGERSFVTALPHSTGTAFLERFTAFVYMLTGGSQLAGFITFAFLGYVGTVFFVKAAVIAVPTIALRRYAWMCVLIPSIVYWPSSIGKEAVVILGLGIGTYGIAVLLAHGRWLSSLPIIVCGLGLVGLIRPHLAGIWVAATVPALVVAFVRGSRRTESHSKSRQGGKFGLVVVLFVAIVGLSVLAAATIRFLSPAADDDTSTGDSLTLILEETARRTGQAGSNFAPPSVSSPLDWPYAVARTLTRPLPFEAQGVAQLVAATEMTVLLGIYIMSRRRLANLPRLIVTSPYVMFAVAALFLAGLAYTSLANLGILTRQKSLLMPFLALLPCLPERPRLVRPGPGCRPTQTEWRVRRPEADQLLTLASVGRSRTQMTTQTSGLKSDRRTADPAGSPISPIPPQSHTLAPEVPYKPA